MKKLVKLIVLSMLITVICVCTSCANENKPTYTLSQEELAAIAQAIESERNSDNNSSIGGVTVENNLVDGAVKCNEQFEYCYLSGIDGIKLIKFIGKSEGSSGIDIVIPEELEGKSVKIIGNNFACKRDDISSIAISDSVIEIQENAFSYSRNMITGKGPVIKAIGNNVETIGKRAFVMCTFEDTLTIPDSVKLIDEYAFASSNIHNGVIIGHGVEAVKQRAFEGAKWTADRDIDLVIPGNVKYIGDWAFSKAGFKTITIEDGVEKIGDYGVACDGSHCYLPDTVPDMLPTSILYLRGFNPVDTTFTYKGVVYSWSNETGFSDLFNALGIEYEPPAIIW